MPEKNDCLYEYYLSLPQHIINRFVYNGKTIEDFAKRICPNFNTDSGFGAGKCICAGCWTKDALDLKSLIDQEMEKFKAGFCVLGFMDRYGNRMTEDEKNKFIKILKNNKCPAYSLSSKNRGHDDACETEYQFSTKCWTPQLEKIKKDVLTRVKG